MKESFILDRETSKTHRMLQFAQAHYKAILGMTASLGLSYISYRMIKAGWTQDPEISGGVLATCAMSVGGILYSLREIWKEKVEARIRKKHGISIELGSVLGNIEDLIEEKKEQRRFLLNQKKFGAVGSPLWQRNMRHLILQALREGDATKAQAYKAYLEQYPGNFTYSNDSNVRYFPSMEESENRALHR